MSEQHNQESQTPSQQELKEALDKSSSINRTLGLGFSVFIFIMALMVAATTDMDLFIPDSTFTFPLINLPLNIKYFYIAAPFVVLIMHYNLLYNLHQHSEKLLRLYTNKTNDHSDANEAANETKPDSLLMYPFLFNYALTVQNPLHSLALNLVIRTTIFILPLALLFYILIRFADYQSMAISAWHFAAVLLDMALIATHSRSIIQVIKTSDDKVSDAYGWRDFFTFRHGKPRFYNFVLNAGKFLLHIVPAVLSSVAAFMFFGVIDTVSFITPLKFRNWISFSKSFDYQALAYKFLRLELFTAWLAVAYFVFFVYIMNVNIGLNTAHEGLISLIIPSLTLPEEILVKSQPDQQKKALYLNTSITPKKRSKMEQEIMLKFTEPYILKGRSFRYASLRETILTRSDLRGADLTGAYLVDSKMQEARLERVKLHAADLRNAQLQGVILGYAELQGAVLSNAQLQGTKLFNTQLQGANFWAAKLQGANFWAAKLQGANLSNAQLQGVILGYAELQGADLVGADLQGTDLSDAQLQGAILGYAELQGADLRSAQLQGAILDWSDLQGANLREAELQGANLSEAILQGVIFDETRIKGAHFSDATVDTLLIINEPYETKDLFVTDNVIDSIASLIQIEKLKSKFTTRMYEAKARFENDTLSLAEKIPNAKIYRPEGLATDSSFFFIRRRIAAQDKDVARRMLASARFFDWNREAHPIYKSLYTDLYQFLKSNHPDYLQGFKYDEEGNYIYTEE
jgi:uncharacterized protein YjbI with pentapeptide repeats